MALKTANDLHRGLPYKKLNVTASGNAVLTAPVRIFKITICGGGAAAGSLIVYNAATATGTDLVKIQALTNDFNQAEFGPNGIVFDVGVSTTLAGAGAVAEIYYLSE